MRGRKVTFRTVFRLFWRYVNEFTQLSTLHGVKYISTDNLHFLEVLLWFILLTTSVFSAYKLIGESYQRYNENPTVITIQKNYRDWAYTFPAATFCFNDNLDSERATDFIKKTWHVKPIPKDEILAVQEEDQKTGGNESFTDTSSSNGTNDTENNSSEDRTSRGTFRYYFTFLQKLVNQTYVNMEFFIKYTSDDTIANLNVKNAVLEVIREHKMRSTFYTKDFNYTEFSQIPTEMGMCYVHGGKLSDYITLGNALRLRKNFQPPTCNYPNTLCYARTEGFPSEVRFYVHSPFELPDSSQSFFLVTGRMEKDVAFGSLETTVSPGIEKLNPSQRQCRFWYEPVNSHLRVYSFNLCRMQCRKELSFKLCGCAPYFYTAEKRIPVCNVTGLACLSQFSQMLITLRTNKGTGLPCNCLPQCEDVRYNIDKEITRSWMYPIPYDIRFRWSMEKFSRIRLRRDVIYSFTDLVVSFGGIAAFFLGCSVLSFVEIIYFFSLRLIWFIRRTSSQ